MYIKEQLAFDEDILDNALIVTKVTNSMHFTTKGKIGGLSWKLDINKAYLQTYFKYL